MFMMKTKSEKGFTLFTTLLLLATLAMVFGVLQIRLTQSSLVLAKLEKKHAEQLEFSSAFQQAYWHALSVKFDVEDNGSNITAFNPLFFSLKNNHSTQNLALQDLSGLININHAAPALLILYFSELYPSVGRLIVDRIIADRSQNRILNLPHYMNRLAHEFQVQMSPFTLSFLTVEGRFQKLSVQNTPIKLLQILSSNALEREASILKIGRRHFTLKHVHKIQVTVAANH